MAQRLQKGTVILPYETPWGGERLNIKVQKGARQALRQEKRISIEESIGGLQNHVRDTIANPDSKSGERGKQKK